MSTRRTWTTAEMRELSQKLGPPPWPPYLADQVKAALLYAADLIDAAQVVIDAQKGKA